MINQIWGEKKQKTSTAEGQNLESLWEESLLKCRESRLRVSLQVLGCVSFLLSFLIYNKKALLELKPVEKL